jgi:hypothetical protein
MSVQIHEYKSAIDFLYDDVLCDGKWSQELSDLYDWIVERGKDNELDFILNREFPNGADKDEMQDFIVTERKRIERELCYKKCD